MIKVSDSREGSIDFKDKGDTIEDDEGETMHRCGGTEASVWGLGGGGWTRTERTGTDGTGREDWTGTVQTTGRRRNGHGWTGQRAGPRMQLGTIGAGKEMGRAGST
ncbi:unnamed protein product [Calypogeia fissa]